MNILSFRVTIQVPRNRRSSVGFEYLGVRTLEMPASKTDARKPFVDLTPWEQIEITATENTRLCRALTRETA